MNGSPPKFDDAVARIVAVTGLVGVALVHVLQLPDAFAAVDYVGVLFVLLIVACLALAALMTRTSDRRLWLAAGALPALVLIGYVLSRTSGLPGFTDDVGDWTEPLGLASLVFEGLLVCLSIAVVVPDDVLARAAHPRTVGRAYLPNR